MPHSGPFSLPPIKPGGRFSRIRLSDQLHGRLAHCAGPAAVACSQHAQFAEDRLLGDDLMLREGILAGTDEMPFWYA